MRKHIVWDKWIDPFFVPDEELDEDKDYDFDDEDDESEGPKSKSIRKGGPVIVGPMGIIPINEHNQPSKIYDFWMIHTNFDIGPHEKEIIETCPGVETLDIFTRYRCRISIGKTFNQKQVQKLLEKRLCGKPKVKRVQSTNKQESVDRLKKQLSAHYKHWAIFVMPDGQLDYACGESESVVKEKIASYPNKESKVCTSWEVNKNESNKESGTKAAGN
jgi:hypothetical protein